MTDAAAVIQRLGLRPLEGEGGYFVETWRGAEIELPDEAGPLAGQRRAQGTAVYYLITPDSFSTLHRLKADEIFHFYLGDPCEMLLLHPNGDVSTSLLGTDLAAGMRPQVIVPAGVWQGTRVRDGGRMALLGTTMAPGFHLDDFELARPDELVVAFPGHRDAIARFLP